MALESPPTDGVAPARHGVPPTPPVTPAISRREWLVAAALSVVAAALFTWPVLASGDRWGVNDWDQHQLYWDFARWSIVERGEPPWWNAYMCGGMGAFANPQSPVGSPLFAVVLAAGTVTGLKLLIGLHAALACLGAWLFGRRLGCSPVAAYVPAAAFGLSSVYATHVATGHSTWLAMAFVPFALASLHAGFAEPRRAAWGGVAAALLVLAGNANLFAWLFYAAGVWTAAEAIRVRSLRPLVALAVLAAVAVGLAAWKLLPMTAFLEQRATVEITDTSSGNLAMFGDALLGRDHGMRAHRDAGLAWGFWEYSAYVGPLVLAGALTFSVVRFRRVWPLVAMATACLWMSLGSGYGAWDVVGALPGFKELRIPSRAIAFAPLALGVLAGLLLTEHARRLPRGVAAALVTLVALDIGWVSRTPFVDSFTVPPVHPVMGAFEQARGPRDFQNSYDEAQRRHVAAYTQMYPWFLANRGTTNCYDRLQPRVHALHARARTGAPNPAYRGEAWVEPAGDAKVVAVGGKTLTIEVAPTTPGYLVVNQNWAPGWSTADGRPVRRADGLLAVAVEPTDRRVVFVFTPPRLAAGVSVTLLTVLVLVVVRARRRRARDGMTRSAGLTRDAPPPADAG